MIAQKYENRIKEIKMPSKADLKAEIFKDFENFVGTKAQIEARENELDEALKDAVRKSRIDYDAARNKVIEDFAAELSSFYGTEVKEVDDKLFQIAEQKGHGGGFHEIENHYSDLVELAEVALQAGKKIGRAERAEDRR